MVAQHTRVGRYEVIGSLARGGMAELFLARLPGVEGFAKQVVIKRVLPELAHDRAFVDMFVAEARIAATLDHQNIVHVHDIGHDDAGYFFAMERLHGGDVGSIMSVVTRFGGELPIAIALEIARGACAGLHYAHERRSSSGDPLGLVHRDVSPQNLFVTFDGAAKLLDFGIAKAFDTMPASHTRTGALRGKVPYMSPEQCRAEPLDRRSDVFALSIVLWEMTVGERLYGGHDSELATARAITDHDAPRPSTRKPGYPPDVERIVMRGLDRDRLARYQTADEMQADLEAVARATSRWASARDLAAFMADVFPERSQAWLDGERRGTSSPSASPRHTTRLPPEALGTPPVPAPPPTLPPAASPTPPPLASPTPPAAAPAPAARGQSWIGAGIAIAGIAVAAAIVLITRRPPSQEPAPAAGSPAASAPAASATAPAASPTAPAAPTASVEDAHGLRPDDYLISKEPYHGQLLEFLWVARPLKPIAGPGRVPFLTAGGEEIETEFYWRTRVASPGDLVFGEFAFCGYDYVGHRARLPADDRKARFWQWMLGRITDLSRLGSGKVTVADIECDVAGVRAIAR